MARIEKSVLVGYSARRMYDLVEGVEAYPHFLPWCGGTEVARDGVFTVATVHIDYHGLKHNFTTANRNEAPVLIEMRLQDGPFRKLEGAWCFRELAEDACKVEFRLEYEFSSKMLEKVFGPVFEYITGNFVDAFVRRAEALYGES